MIRLARAKPAALIMVCEKCFRRTHAKDKLTKALKRALKPHRMRVVRTRCLGVCPRDAVALHDSRKPREWVIVTNGTPADEVAQLFLEAVG